MARFACRPAEMLNALRPTSVASRIRCRRLRAAIGAQRKAHRAANTERIGKRCNAAMRFDGRRRPTDDRERDTRGRVPQEPAPPLVQALRAGGLDALISRYPARWPQTPGQRLRYEKRLDAGFAVIAPAGHALARARCVDWQRLAQAPWIMPAASA